MDRRRNPRVTALLPIRVWGIDSQGLPFMQLARARNISSSGALIQGMCRQVLPGEILEVQIDQEKAQFRVVWADSVGMPGGGEIGVQTLTSEPCIWDLNVNLCHCSQLVGEG